MNRKVQRLKTKKSKRRRVRVGSPRNYIVPLFTYIIDSSSSKKPISDIIYEGFSKNIHVKPQKPLIVCDDKTWGIAGSGIYEELKGKSRKISKKISYVKIEGNDHSNVEKIVNEAKIRRPITRRKADSRYNIIFSVGGGSVIDVGKYAAYKLNIPQISITTSLSNDGFASPFSVLKLEDGKVETLKANVPVGVIVDLDLIAQENEGYKRRINSGIGDILSNLTAILDWKLAAELTRYDSRHEPLDDNAIMLSRTAAENVLYSMNNKSFNIRDKNFLERLASSLILSANAMGIYGSSRPASGFEHKFYHMYNKLKDYKACANHGELVGIAALVSAYAHNKYYKELLKVYKKIGLPTKEKDLQKIGVSKDDFKTAIEMCIDFRTERYTILDKVKPEKMKNYVDEVFR